MEKDTEKLNYTVELLEKLKLVREGKRNIQTMRGINFDSNYGNLRLEHLDEFHEDTTNELQKYLTETLEEAEQKILEQIKLL